MENSNTKPFTYEKRPISNSVGINIGFEIVLHGELIFGSTEKELEEAKRLSSEIVQLSDTEVVAINLLDFDEWHSVGVVAIVGSVLDLNKKLLSEKRVPVSFIGDRAKDYFDAVKDKFLEDNDTDRLPWFQSLQDFLTRFKISEPASN